ncbi:MAG: tRNA (adenosine(37)-N6)-threonylcarbamoyltransferase complex ATPase subunit type 1 TsaE [Gammaproteobacteria bacterium]|nr:tRNA (adenosine(37)-N6)-threonylcarbamoyltransferase complex ATPase subunit type 1 TsaE [Gammaproteobacteria bacterium]MDD9874909.1 tRNA (adenosine(37)-N6)-threonylcarbamoyltransferase complex ATPase subunit type 1 TsaE [Gammaproteobacteria bacterium]
MQSFNIPSEDAMLELGHSWAGCIGGGAVVFLDGDLGAGKTTLARGILRGMGHRGAVTSPTYTLVEHYAPGGRDIYHFDLYRLEDPAELEMTGLRDFLDGCSILLVEWPQRGAGRMPLPDFYIDIRYHGDARRVRIDGGVPGTGVTHRPRPC